MAIENPLKDKILSEAIRIADDILSKAEKEKAGVSWKTLSQDMNQNSSWNKSENIYSGVSGIVIFLLELYKVTNEKKYLTAAIEGMNWVEDYCNQNSTNYYPFLTGRIGAAFAMLKMAKTTGDKKYIQKALAIAKNCDAYLKSDQVMDEYINGSAGVLVCLLHLHAVTNEPWLLKKIDLYIDRILNNCFAGSQGIYWDRSNKNIHGLCGFSHGAAGIGFTFLELGNYFQNPAFYIVAEQAFLYESHYYSEEQKNWPDFRKGIFAPDDYEKHKEAYLKSDIDFFTKPGYMSNWCHGANGIGLSRIRAFELLKDPIYRQETEIAIEKTIAYTINTKSELQSQCYCHGESGDAEIFLEAYRILKDQKYLDKAILIADKLIKINENKRIYNHGYAMLREKDRIEDISLYMGNAGIGYFYLKLLNPLDTESLLASSVRTIIKEKKTDNNYSFINISASGIKEIILSKSYPRTLIIAKKILAEKLQIHLSEEKKNTRPDFIRSFEYFIENNISTLSAKNQEVLKDVYGLEKEKKNMDQSIQSDSMVYIKEVSKAENKIAESAKETFLNLKLKCDSGIKIYHTKWDWNFSNKDIWVDNIDSEPDDFPVLLQITHNGITEYPLSVFTYAVINAFKKNAITVKDAVATIMNEFEEIPIEQKPAVEEKLITQVKEMIITGFLEPV